MNHDYNELDICRMADTDPREGTPVENIAGFFDSIGWKTTSHADTVKYFESRVDFEVSGQRYAGHGGLDRLGRTLAGHHRP